ncbi:class I SAM-dependent methyltransferase [Actinomadura roseirufa]|uniref:methyltransferase domain-containing protein n=1 Tax=Actinomadura roseirufa TaxID=2094049 RepID=UPI00104119E8|nr:class I SAM-dependent methyltransferase [Actinomadura roseirufa]
MGELPGRLADHPDRLRWNARYEDGAGGTAAPHPLAGRVLALGPPAGPVLDLASGPSGGALLFAAAGRRVTAVDISDVALRRLAAEARDRGLDGLITVVEADLGGWRPGPAAFAAVLCTGYWDRAIFAPAAGAVLPGGLLAWEAFTVEARRARPALPEEWCLGPGEPATLLPDGFTVLEQEDLPDAGKRRLIARRNERR